MTASTTDNHRNLHLATLSESAFLDADELDFARETLGPRASQEEIEELAAQRAHTAYIEYLDDLDDFDTRTGTLRA